MLLENPFNIEGKWYKGNLHTHTNCSDGAWSPQRVMEEYKLNGYNFLFITDHNKAFDFSDVPEDGLLVLSGEELDIGTSEMGYRYHIVALNIKETISALATKDPQDLIDLIKSKGGEAIIAHPYWSGLTVGDIIRLDGHIGIEIFNSTCYFCIAKGHSIIHWDELLDRGILINGFAVDDSHQHFNDHRHIDICNAWIMIKAKELTEKEIISAIKSGHFYSSNGPIIYDISVNDGKIKASTSEVKIINFISNAHNGESFTAKGSEMLTEAEYKISGQEKFIRVECFDKDGRTAWSNPIMFNK